MITNRIPAVPLTNARDHIFDIYRQIHKLKYSSTSTSELSALTSKLNACEQNAEVAKQTALNASKTATDSLTESKKLTDVITYGPDGLDTDKVSDHFKSLITQAIGQLSVLVTNEDGIFLVDKNLNVGVSIDSDGLHAINILEYTTN